MTKTTIMTRDSIAARQVEWATRKRIALDGAYTVNLGDNIFGGELHPMTGREYEREEGHEMAGDKAHMRALHSSSALAVNVFDYWRRRNRVQDIASCCGAGSDVFRMEFEKTYPIDSVGWTPPHLDVEFDGRSPLAIESKFTETYRRKTKRANADTHLDRYLAQHDLWSGIPRVQTLAKTVVQRSGTTTEFQYLDVPQLIKHILGLNCSYHGRCSLLYLWYRVDSPEADRHEQELERFSSMIGSNIRFRAMTHQDLFDRIKRLPDADPVYVQYMEQRYFPSGTLVEP